MNKGLGDSYKFNGKTYYKVKNHDELEKLTNISFNGTELKTEFPILCTKNEDGKIQIFEFPNTETMSELNVLNGFISWLNKKDEYRHSETWKYMDRFIEKDFSSKSKLMSENQQKQCCATGDMINQCRYENTQSFMSFLESEISKNCCY